MFVILGPTKNGLASCLSTGRRRDPPPCGRGGPSQQTKPWGWRLSIESRNRFQRPVRSRGDRRWGPLRRARRALSLSRSSPASVSSCRSTGGGKSVERDAARPVMGVKNRKICLHGVPEPAARSDPADGTTLSSDPITSVRCTVSRMGSRGPAARQNRRRVRRHLNGAIFTGSMQQFVDEIRQQLPDSLLMPRHTCCLAAPRECGH